MIVWGGRSWNTGDVSLINTGGRYDPQIDAWRTMSTDGAPSGCAWPTAIWTGTHMIIWDGSEKKGGIYDPTTDTWTSMETENAPEPREAYTYVWTGKAMIIWGGGKGDKDFNSGASYIPRKTDK